MDDTRNPITVLVGKKIARVTFRGGFYTFWDEAGNKLFSANYQLVFDAADNFFDDSAALELAAE